MNGYGDRRRIETEIASLFEHARNAQLEVQASLARYACILASSYLEVAFREVVSAYCASRANDNVRRYVDFTLRTFRNPNMENILQLVGRFDLVYRESLAEKSAGRLKDSVDSISANRNNIAHGRSSGISLGQVKSYFEDARTVVSKASAILDG